MITAQLLGRATPCHIQVVSSTSARQVSHEHSSCWKVQVYKVSRSDYLEQQVQKVQRALRGKSRSSKSHSRAIRINHADPLSNKRHTVSQCHYKRHLIKQQVCTYSLTEGENRWLGMMGVHQALKKGVCCDQGVSGNSGQSSYDGIIKRER